MYTPRRIELVLLVSLCALGFVAAQTFGDPCSVDADCENGDIGGTPKCFNGNCTKICFSNDPSLDACLSEPAYTTDSCTDACDLSNQVCKLTSDCDSIAPGGCALTFACMQDTCRPASTTCVPPPTVCETIACVDVMGTFECVTTPIACVGFNPAEPCIVPECDPVLGCIEPTITCDAPGDGVCFNDECSTTTPGTCEQTPIPFVPPLGVDPNCIVDSGPCDLVNGYDSPTIVNCNTANDDPCGIYSCQAGTHECVKTGEITDDVFRPTGGADAPFINCQTGAISRSNPVSLFIRDPNATKVNSTNPNVRFVNKTRSDGTVRSSVVVSNTTADIALEISNLVLVSPEVISDESAVIIVELTVRNITLDEEAQLTPFATSPGSVTTGTPSEVYVGGCDPNAAVILGGGTQAFSCIQNTGFAPVTTLDQTALVACFNELAQSRSSLQVALGNPVFDKNRLEFLQQCKDLGFLKRKKRAVLIETPEGNGTLTINLPLNPEDFTNSSTIVIDVDIIPFSLDEYINKQLQPQVNKTAYNCSLSRCTWVTNNQFCPTTSVEDRWPSSFCGLTEQELYELEVEEDMWFFAVNTYLSLRNSFVCTNAFEFDPQLNATTQIALDDLASLLSATCVPVTEFTLFPVSYNELKSAASVARDILLATACSGEIESDRVCPLTDNQRQLCNSTTPSVSTAARSKTVECRETPYRDTGVSYYTFIADMIFAPTPVPPPRPPPPTPLPPAPEPSPTADPLIPLYVFFGVFGGVVAVGIVTIIILSSTRRPT